MTVFAIIMTALAAFLLGANFGAFYKKRPDKKAAAKKAERKGLSPITVEDYRNFLSYDGSEQI